MFKQKQRSNRIPFITPVRLKAVPLLVMAFVFLFSLSALLYTRAGTPLRVHAATSDNINFQARLLTASGAIVADGTYNVEFKLYDVDTGGTALWTETRLTTDGASLQVQVRSGYLSVYLGAKTAFPSTINWDKNTYLTMNIGGTGGTPSWDGEMTPRLKLTAVPFAMAAGQLAKLTGANTSTLKFDTQTTANSILLPNAGGTLAIATSGSLTNNGVLYGNGTTSIQATAAGTTGQCLVATTSSAPTWSTCAGSGSGSTLQAAYNNGNTITTTDARNVTITLADTTTDSNLDIQVATGSTSTVSISRVAGAGTTNPAQLLVIEDLDADLTLADGLTIRTAGVLTDAIDVSDAEIVNAINIGANAIAGTAFSVTGTGAVTAVGVNSGSGLIQGTGGLTSSGAITFSGLSTAGIVTNTSGGVLGTTATVPIANGGTNASTSQGAINNLSQLTIEGDLLYRDATNSTRLARGTNGQCLTSNASTVVWGSCGSTTTLQTAYTASTGSTTPEIHLDSNRNAVDIQDADTTLGATTNLLAVRASATASTLGTLLFGVQGSGASTFTTLQPASGNATDVVTATGGKGANTATAGNGGGIVLTSGAGGDGATANGNGGNITLQGGAAGAGAGTAGARGNILLQTSGGNVGIGTAAPAQLLHLSKSTLDSDTLIRVTNDADTWDFGIIGSGGDDFVIKNNTANIVRISDNSESNSLYIAQSSRVGLRTSSPSAQLNVVGEDGTSGGTGTAGTNGLIVTSGNGGNSSTASTAGGLGGTINLTAGNGGNSTGVAGTDGANITLQGGAGGTGTSTGSYGNILLQTNGGNVGIGDSTPSSRLEVGDGTDSLQVSSVGDITFVDADGAASITGSAGGALSILAGASQALTLTGNAASTWSTTSGALTLQAAGSGTISRIQLGAGGAGSTTPDFLGLDAKSDTGDPAGGAEGYMYYNTFDNKFRCFQNIAWTDCISSATGITGSGASGQATFWNGTSTVTGDNEFLWNNTTKALALGNTTGATLSVRKTNSSLGPIASFDNTQTTLNLSDQGDGTFKSLYTASASSVTNQLISRNAWFVSTNNITGGGTLGLRGLEVQHNTNASTTTANLDGIVLSNEFANGTVTKGRGIYIASVQGVTRAGIVIEPLNNLGSPTNKSLIVLGATDAPSGIYSLYSASADQSYFGGNVGIGDTSPSSRLEVGDGTDSLQVSSVGDLTFVDADSGASITGPAGGALSVVAGASQALTLTGNAASTWSTTSGIITLQASGSGTISRVQIGAGVAGSTTPDFLGLDVKSDTGDPAGGAEGYMYYNTFDNKFRCFQGSAWTDCIGSGGGGVTGSGTTGQVTFWNGASTVTGDNGFFWDNTNKRLGIGTVSPSSYLHVVGTAGATSTTATQTLQVTGGQGGAGTTGGAGASGGSAGNGSLLALITGQGGTGGTGGAGGALQAGGAGGTAGTGGAFNINGGTGGTGGTGGAGGSSANGGAGAVGAVGAIITLTSGTGGAGGNGGQAGVTTGVGGAGGNGASGGNIVIQGANGGTGGNGGATNGVGTTQGAAGNGGAGASIILQGGAGGAVGTGTGSPSVGAFGSITIQASGGNTTIGNITGTAGTTILAGTGNLSLGNGGIANTIQLGNTTGGVAQTIGIGNNATASSTSTITMGNLLGTSSTLVQGGTGSSAISVQVGTSGTISIGSNSANTINLGTGNFDHTINIGSSLVNAQTIIIGSAVSGSVSSLRGATVNIAATASSVNPSTVNIASTSDATSDQIVTIGSLASRTTNTTTIQGGTGANAIAIKAGSGGTISLGTGGVANTIQIGTTTGAVAQTINIGNNSTASSTNTVVLGSTVGGTTTLQGSTSLTLSNVTTLSALGTSNTSTYLCRNSSNQFAGCSTTGSGAFFAQGGNSFGAIADLGTIDNFALNFRVSNGIRLQITTAGGLAFQQASTISTTTGDLTVTPNSGNDFNVSLAGTGNITISSSSLTSDKLLNVSLNQTSVNTTDTGDGGFSVGYTLLASSASNQLISRGAYIFTGNSLTGGGSISNLRAIEITSNTASGSTTGTLDQLYISTTNTQGTVTNNRVIYVQNAQGTSRAGLTINDLSAGGSPTNISYVLLGTGTIPSGNYAIHSATTYQSYFNGNVGVGVNPPTARLHVVGANQGTATVAAPDALVVVGGAGGAADATTVGGAGGLISLQAGRGGLSSSTQIGGVGGTLSLSAGNGGFADATGESGADGGVVIISGGNGGKGDTGPGATTGNGGGVSITGGSIGDSDFGALKGTKKGGSVTISGGGAGGGSPRGGAGGDVIINGASGGNSNLSGVAAGAGGAITLQGGQAGLTQIAGAAGANGGIVSIMGGDGNGNQITSNGASVYIVGGFAGTGGVSGDVKLGITSPSHPTSPNAPRGNIVIGLSTDDVGQLLVLDNKSASAEATGGVNGAMYYNTGLLKFRCFENGAWTNCVGGGASTLQDAYGGDADGSDTIIALTTADDSLIIRNPSSAGTDSGYVQWIDQLNTGAVDGLRITSAGTGALLKVTDTTATAQDVLTIADGGATTLKNQTNSTSAFKVNNVAGTDVFNVDTTNSKVGTSNQTAGSTSSSALTIKSGDASGATSNSGAVVIDSGTATGTSGNVSIGTGAYAHNITIGNTTSTSSLTIQAGSGNIILGSGTLQRTATGTTTLNLIDGSNTIYALTNSGAGVANLTVDGNGTFATGLTVSAGGVTVTGNSTIAGTLTSLTGLTSSGTVSSTGVLSATGNTTLGDAITDTITMGGAIQGLNAMFLDGATAGGFEYTIAVTDPSADRTYTIPQSSATADTFCLLILANCAGSATTLQTSYAADVDGSDAIIALTTADDSLIISNPATGGTDSAFLIQSGNAATGSAVANFKNLNVTQTGSYTTAAANLTNYAGYFSNASTESAGANVLTNVGLYATATGGNVNYAAIFESGSVGVGTSAPSATFNVQNTSTTAVIIQKVTAGTALFTADTTNMLVKLGAGTPAITSAASGGLYVTNHAEIVGRLLVGTTTNGSDTNSGQVRFTGTFRNTVPVILVPEYSGLTLIADGTSNTGTLTSSFCSGTSVLSINTSACGASDEHNYYEWTTAETTVQDYDMYIRYKLPADFDGFVDDNTIKLFARSTDIGNEFVQATTYRGATTCGSASTTINSSNATWQETSLGGSETGCSFVAGDIMTIKIKVRASSAGSARVGAFSFSYFSKF